MVRIYIDETGVGGFFVQDAVKAGLKNAVGVFLSLSTKQRIMDYLKRLKQDGHLHFQRDPDLLNEMSAERYELSKTGQLQFSHPSGTRDDRLWALAPAVYASRPEVPEYRGAVIRGRSMRLLRRPPKPPIAGRDNSPPATVIRCVGCWRPKTPINECVCPKQ